MGINPGRGCQESLFGGQATYEERVKALHREGYPLSARCVAPKPRDGVALWMYTLTLHSPNRYAGQGNDSRASSTLCGQRIVGHCLAENPRHPLAILLRALTLPALCSS